MRFGLVVSTLAAAPAAFVLEGILRAWFLPPDFELVRRALAPWVTPVGWVLAGLTALVGLVASVGLRRRLPAVDDTAVEGPAVQRLASRRARREVALFFVASSLPQLPAIAATLAVLFGAPSGTAWLAIAMSSCWILGFGHMIWASQGGVLGRRPDIPRGARDT